MNESGYALVLFVLILASVSGAWLIQTAPGNDAAVTTSSAVEVAEARLALLAYATNYMTHYKPRGAGPGHFPCPDTDAPTTSDGLSQYNNWHLDGPNPPCANNTVEYGWLPRHVNVLKGRYHFHQRARQRLWYAVSGRFVNNPVNRTVNNATLGNMAVTGFDDVIAIIAAPKPTVSGNGGKKWWKHPSANDDIGAYALIRSADLRGPMKQWVGHWLTATMNEIMVQHCQNVVPTQSAYQSLVNEVLSNERESVRGSTEPGLCTRIISSKVQCESANDSWLLSWLTTTPVESGCLLDTAGKMLDNVPIQHHWFVRNQWPEHIKVIIEAPCESLEESVCLFKLHTDNTTDGITIQLLPVLSFAQSNRFP